MQTQEQVTEGEDPIQTYVRTRKVMDSLKQARVLLSAATSLADIGGVWIGDGLQKTEQWLDEKIGEAEAKYKKAESAFEKRGEVSQ